MDERFSRTANLIGADAVDRLEKATVAVFGIGGVGSFAAEALARGGVGSLYLVDKDEVDITNINRQLIALSSTVGRSKVEVAAERIHDINPHAEVIAEKMFFLPETAGGFDFSGIDYILDAVDNVTAKLLLAEKAAEHGIPIISAMGAGNKLDPTLFRVADIFETSVCPLARVMRTELRRRGIKRMKVVYSTEQPTVSRDKLDPRTPASISFVPPVVGLIMAGEVIKDLIQNNDSRL